MKKIFIVTVIAFGFISYAGAQEKSWTLDACMRYAVENSPKVKKQEHSYNTYKAEQTQSLAAFLPSVSMQTDLGWGFGRSVDDSYNYINTTNLSNGYSLNANMPIFSGGQLINGWRLAKVNRQLGMTNVQKTKDDLSITIMSAYVDVLYYQGTVTYAEEKLNESKKTFLQSQRMVELGLKGKADLAQVEAQVAADDYFLINQHNLYDVAVLTLKNLMNFPADQDLPIESLDNERPFLSISESTDDIYAYALSANPTALQSEYQLDAAKMQLLIEKGKLFPTISFWGGVYTDYYKDLKAEEPGASFSSQFKNKRRESVGFTLSIPLFNRLTRVTGVRRARNNVRIAAEQQTEVLRELQTAIEKAVLEREGLLKETIQMEKKKDADHYSYQVTLRKYEEGLMSPLDVQTSSNALIQSKANLLLKKLTYFMKCREVDYYKGEPLIMDN